MQTVGAPGTLRPLESTSSLNSMDFFSQPPGAANRGVPNMPPPPQEQPAIRAARPRSCGRESFHVHASLSFAFQQPKTDALHSFPLGVVCYLCSLGPSRPDRHSFRAADLAPQRRAQSHYVASSSWPATSGGPVGFSPPTSRAVVLLPLTVGPVFRLVVFLKR